MGVTYFELMELPAFVIQDWIDALNAEGEHEELEALSRAARE